MSLFSNPNINPLTNEEEVNKVLGDNQIEVEDKYERELSKFDNFSTTDFFDYFHDKHKESFPDWRETFHNISDIPKEQMMECYMTNKEIPNNSRANAALKEFLMSFESLVNSVNQEQTKAIDNALSAYDTALRSISAIITDYGYQAVPRANNGVCFKKDDKEPVVILSQIDKTKLGIELGGYGRLSMRYEIDLSKEETKFSPEVYQNIAKKVMEVERSQQRKNNELDITR